MGFPNLDALQAEGNRRRNSLFKRLEYYLQVIKDSEDGNVKDNLLRIGTLIYEKLKEVDGAFMLHGVEFLEMLSYYESLMVQLTKYLTGKKEKDSHYEEIINFYKQIFNWEGGSNL
jgi:hypothetical protein